MQEQTRPRSTRSKMPPRGWLKSHRAVGYQAPPRSRARRFFGKLFNRWTFTAALFVFLAGFLLFTYYWFAFSDEIDRRLLSGEVFTPSAGIYTAPKLIRK